MAVAAVEGGRTDPARAPWQTRYPTIELVVGYNKTNTSPILKLFPSRLDQLKRRLRKLLDSPHRQIVTAVFFGWPNDLRSSGAEHHEGDCRRAFAFVVPAMMCRLLAVGTQQ